MLCTRWLPLPTRLPSLLDLSLETQFPCFPPLGSLPRPHLLPHTLPELGLLLPSNSALGHFHPVMASPLHQTGSCSEAAVESDPSFGSLCQHESGTQEASEEWL